MAEPAGTWIMGMLTAGMEPTSWLSAQLAASAPHLRLFLMGLILLLVLRFAPRGLIPEARGR
jgi:branched-chain amino acid transport system permease protein